MLHEFLFLNGMVGLLLAYLLVTWLALRALCNQNWREVIFGLVSTAIVLIAMASLIESHRSYRSSPTVAATRLAQLYLQETATQFTATIRIN